MYFKAHLILILKQARHYHVHWVEIKTKIKMLFLLKYTLQEIHIIVLSLYISKETLRLVLLSPVNIYLHK